MAATELLLLMRHDPARRVNVMGRDPGRCRRLAWVLAAIAASACDQSFEPIQESDLQYSVFGYLDASAQTQWIRIMPIRRTVVTARETSGITAWLVDLATGGTIALRDSVMRLDQHNIDVGADGVFVHNFWTTERITPGSTFRLEAVSTGGEPSVAEVKVPADYLVELWLRQPFTNQSDLVRLVGLRHVAFVTLIVQGRDACGPWTYTRHFPLPDNESDEHLIPVGRFVSRLGCQPSVTDKEELRIVGSGAPWPIGRDYETQRLAVTEAPSNVSYAVGFLGGVLTKRFPYGTCTLEGPGATTGFCVLTFDDGAARIEGRVVEAGCFGRPIRQAMVRLAELSNDPTALRRIRTATTDSTGSYAIHGLRPETRHALAITHTARVPEMNNILLYEERADTLEFGAGEQRTYDAPLVRRAPC